jgi:cyclic lactone autoinducer peptide
MKAVKQKVLSVIADLGKRTAVKSAGAAWFFCYHQPKEPACLHNMKTAKSEK